jgi:peptidoglycan/LPS O-acetylase OafA/YrhL
MTAPRLLPLDELRGCAIPTVQACTVLAGTTGAAWAPVPLPLERVTNLGWTGVDVFFVLSGFLLGGILIDTRGLRRAARILPLYYVWLLIYLVTLAVVTGRIAEPGLAYYFLFAQDIGMAFGRAASNWWTAPAWSLAVEDQFYLILPVVVAVLTPKALRKTLIVYLILAEILRGAAITIFHLRSVQRLYLLLPTHGDGLAVGVLVAILVRSEAALNFYGRNRRALAIAAFGLAVNNTAALLLGGRGLDPFPPLSAYTYTPVALVYGCLLLKPSRFRTVGWPNPSVSGPSDSSEPSPIAFTCSTLSASVSRRRGYWLTPPSPPSR